MKLQVTPICEAELEEVSGFLVGVFGVDKGWAPFQPKVLRWKALEAHPLWAGSRGYALRREGEMVAYGCAWPTRFLRKTSEMLAACVVDWAASKTAAGGGAVIYQHIGKLTEGMIGVGGSEDARRVMPRLGFRDRQELQTSARVTRPLRNFLDTRERTWRTAAHLGRNLVRGFQAPRANTAGWSAHRVERFDERVAAVAPKPGLVSSTVCFRSADVLNYFLACPAARMEGYLLERGGNVAGYFVLAFLRNECRVAELWVASAEQKDWEAAYALASQGRDADQVTTGTSTSLAARAAARTGFHVIARQPVYVKDPGERLPGELDATMSLLAMDAFFL